ncbi:MAG TPA: alanine racemase [Candidatus Baltobacteraceae bacterium]|nr:alanine racemase [Candidatus Baltobacteraceae bacterium]
MQPDLSLDIETVKANARAWRAFARGALYAVVKGDGYGWGVRPLVKALEDVADAYCVSDAEELDELRKHTQTPAVILGSVEPDRLAGAYRTGAQPSIGTPIELEIAQHVFESLGKPLRVRVGVRPAAAWSGLSLAEISTFAPALAKAGASVQLWTHITDFERRQAQIETFQAAARTLEAAHVHVESRDIQSTFPLAADGPVGDSVRVGVGLFGATGGFEVPGVRCALRVTAPVIRIERHSAGTRVGYGGTMLADGETIATARCGYADGLPKALEGADDILSVGMQYVTARVSRLDDSETQLPLLDGGSDLDAFAARCGLLPHEIVTAFGNRARAGGVSVEV